MVAIHEDGAALARWRDAAPPDGEVVELLLLLPEWQASALEAAARSHGLTVGQMVRRLVRDFCAVPPGLGASRQVGLG
jgi:hypothetical protein